jgi:hypothetical protein
MGNTKTQILEEFLAKEGWKEYPTYPPGHIERVHRLWYKPICTIDCSSNEKSPNLCLNYIEFNMDWAVSENITLSITGEVAETTWYALQAYSLSIKDFIEHSSTIEHKLIASWEALHKGETDG